MIKFFLTIILGVVAIASVSWLGLMIWMWLTVFKVAK